MDKERIDELHRITEDAFAKTAFVSDWNGAIELVGNFCRCNYQGRGHWDVWLCNTKDLAGGLTARKMTNLITGVERLTGSTQGPVQRLTGEAIYVRMPTEALVLAGHFLGIKKRRKAPAHAFKKVTNHQEERSPHVHQA